jgi:hypothetical protein
MTGLFFLFGICLWIVAAIMISKNIPHWLGITKHGAVISVLLFPLIFVAPIADELIGRWQFNRLCEREAVVTLSPDWERVKAARDNDDPIVGIDGYVIPIRVQRVEFVDANTGKPFLTYKGFHTYGGLLFGRLGLGLGQSTSCWPKDKTQLLNKLNIDQLLKQGK